MTDAEARRRRVFTFDGPHDLFPVGWTWAVVGGRATVTAIGPGFVYVVVVYD